MSQLTEAALLREVARVQHDKTLHAVRDLIDGIPTTKPGYRSYSSDDRTAAEFRHDVLKGLKALRDAEREQ